MRARHTISTVMLIAAIATGATACGRRSDLDTPYQAGIDAREEARRAGEPLPPEPAPPVEDRPFVLDGLI